MRAAGDLAFLAVMVSGLLHLAAQFLPRPWSTLGHIDIAELLASTRIFQTHWPYWTFPFEYHPVIAWASAVLSYMTGDLVVLVLAWIVVAALCARAVGRHLASSVGTRRAITFWSLSPQLILFGAQNFDVLAVLTIVLAVAQTAQRPLRAGASLAIGGATKLFPLLALPPLALWSVAHGERGRAYRLIAAAVFVFLLLDLPAVFAPFSLLAYGVTPYSVATWNVDSIWFPVAMALDLVLDPARADIVIAIVTIVGLVASYLWLAVLPSTRTRSPDRLVWLGVAAVVFWTRLRSPQYAIWLLPLFAGWVPDVRLLALMSIGDALSYVGVFGLRGAPRDLLGLDALPFYGAIVIGVLVRQLAVLILILRARAAHAPVGPSATASLA